MVKRLLCLFSAFIVLFSASVPAYAMGTLPIGFEIGLDVASLADLCVSGVRIFGNSLASAFDSDVCGHAPQIGGGHKFVAQRTQVDGQVGLYYVCEYCGKTAGEVLDTTYTSYVETLPGTTVNSDGSFIWKPSFSDFVDNRIVCSGYGGHPDTKYSPSRYLTADNLVVDWRFAAHSSGSFKCYPGTAVAVVNLAADASSRPCFFSFTLVFPWDAYYTSTGSSFSVGTNSLIFSGSSRSLSSIDCYATPQVVPWPEFTVSLLNPDPGSDSDYFSGNRVSVDVSGNGSAGAYGYVENGQLVQSTVGTIYNETLNIYQNPVTGETSSVESWTYDYSDRSYTLTTEEGDTVTVTYGDSNVTINEGGDTYNVYYLVEHEDLPEHNYTSSVTLAPTCTGTGVRTHTCTDCGDTYMETIPATGHTWQVLQTVSTEYDENGQLVREGYTIYQCSICGEQYRIASASGGSALPSPSSGGTSTGGTDLVEIDSSVGRGFLTTIAHGLTEDLPEVLKAASQWFTVFPAFYDGFVSFLTDGVSHCYPDEYKLMMSFGIGMVTIIGIVRKILGR